MSRDRIYRLVAFLVIGFVIRAIGTEMQSGIISWLGTVVLWASCVNFAVRMSVWFETAVSLPPDADSAAPSQR